MDELSKGIKFTPTPKPKAANFENLEIDLKLALENVTTPK